MRKFLVILTLSFVQIIYSQQTNIYHVVSKGETLSKVAQKYRLTPYEIIKLNPNAVNGIKEKDVLIIPKTPSESNSTVVSANSTTNQILDKQLVKETGSLLHVVQSKETKYGVSKLYGLTIGQLEEQNPQIVLGLQVGHKLKISGSTTGYKQDLSKKILSTTVFESKFDYIVLPGETLYGISRRNGLTVDELTKANMSTLNGVLKSGQKLSIPKIKGFVPNETSVTLVSSGSKYHLVEPKETKFELSKKYGVTIEQLESLNPQIINGLQIGQKIVIPSSYKGKEIITDISNPKENLSILKVLDPKVKRNNSDQDYLNYEVRPKETLFSLSKKAGMSVSEFTALNPKLSSAVQIGMIVKMPKNIISSVSSVVVSEKNKVINNQPIIQDFTKSSTLIKDLSLTLDKSVKKQVAIVMPFDEIKYNEYLKDSPDFKKVKDDFVKNNLEFYSGALKALDSLKSFGVDFDLKLTELQNISEETVVAKLAQNDDLSKANLVLMPFYNNKAKQIASDLSTKNIPIITNQLSSKENVVSNLYVGIPSEFEIRMQMLNYLKSKDANFIVVNSNNRVDSKSSISTIFPDAKFVKVSDRNFVDADGLRPMLVKDKLNYVILDTDKTGMIISSTNVLLNESTDYQIQIVVLEPSLLSNYETVSSIRINILKLIYPSFSSLVQSTKLSDSKIKNSLQESQNFLLGFDLTYDTLMRLLQSKGFENSIKEDVTERFKYKFQYNNKSGFNSNSGFYIMQHDTDNEIKILN